MTEAGKLPDNNSIALTPIQEKFQTFVERHTEVIRPGQPGRKSFFSAIGYYVVSPPVVTGNVLIFKAYDQPVSIHGRQAEQYERVHQIDFNYVDKPDEVDSIETFNDAGPVPVTSLFHRRRLEDGLTQHGGNFHLGSSSNFQNENGEAYAALRLGELAAAHFRKLPLTLPT